MRKVCPRCGIEKPLTDYHRNKARSDRDGRKSTCASCENSARSGLVERNKRTRDEDTYSNGKRPGAARKYDLKALEDAALDAHAAWKADDGSETRTALFIGFRELADAVLHVGPFEKFEIDYQHIAYEYALYLFERVITGSFELVALRDRFPLQLYVSKNIKHVIMTKGDNQVWSELLTDMEFLIDLDESDDATNPLRKSFEDAVSTGDEELRHVNRMHYAKKIWGALRCYYVKTEIDRLLPLALDLVYDNPRHVVAPDLPADLRDFTVIMIATAKRLVSQDNIFHATDVKKGVLSRALASAARSTVFLSTVANTNAFPKEFLLALDIDSLYRLVSIMGGKRVRVPTMRQMETLIGSVVAMSKMLMEGKTMDSSVLEAKGDLDLTFSHRFNIPTFISDAMQIYDVFGDEKGSEPLLQLMIKSIKSLDVLLAEIKERAATQGSAELVGEYAKLTSTYSTFTESLVRISSGVRGSTPSAELQIEDDDVTDGDVPSVALA